MKSVTYAPDERLRASVSTVRWPLLAVRVARQLPAVVMTDQVRGDRVLAAQEEKLCVHRERAVERFFSWRFTENGKDSESQLSTVALDVANAGGEFVDWAALCMDSLDGVVVGEQIGEAT